MSNRTLIIDNESVDVFASHFEAGNSDFIRLYDLFIKTNNGFLIVYSVDIRSSFEAVENIYNKITKDTADNIPIIICANKCDLENRVISKEEGEELAHRLNVPYREISAMNNINITESIIALYQIKKNIESSLKNNDHRGCFVQ